jgi:hypothetical protein
MEKMRSGSSQYHPGVLQKTLTGKVERRASKCQRAWTDLGPTPRMGKIKPILARRTVAFSLNLGKFYQEEDDDDEVGW